MSDKGSQRVLVVPGSELDRLGRFQGFSTEAERYLTSLLAPRHVHFMPRSLVEDDPSWKQIIPYVVLKCGDQVFRYVRGASQGESRLHRLKSIGVGGHVEEEDTDGRSSLEGYEVAMKRELEEEVELRSQGVLRTIGLINDDSTPVGSVHLGVVHLYELEFPEVSPREDGLADSAFVTMAELKADRASYETWSQFCIDALLA
jgi:predicted NUDIX family phosphoesterase